MCFENEELFGAVSFCRGAVRTMRSTLQFGKRKTNKHKEIWRDTPTFGPGDSPHFRGIPTTKFLYIFLVYRFSLLPTNALFSGDFKTDMKKAFARPWHSKAVFLQCPSEGLGACIRLATLQHVSSMLHMQIPPSGALFESIVLLVVHAMQMREMTYSNQKSSSLSCIGDRFSVCLRVGHGLVVYRIAKFQPLKSTFHA